jgi:hypothetical protein
MPRPQDVNRQLFHRGHWEIVAGRFREALEPYMGAGDPISLKNTGRHEVGQMARAMAARVAIIKLATSFAVRFQIDSENFDPLIFLDRCSPNPEVYPISQLWDIAQEDHSARL